MPPVLVVRDERYKKHLEGVPHLESPRRMEAVNSILQDPSLKAEQKIGILNKQGWAAYCLDDDVLVKRFGFDPEARYEDYGSNNEVYTDGELLEVETLGPVTCLSPGQRVEHTENWMITKLPGLYQDTDESVVERLLSPLLKNWA